MLTERHVIVISLSSDIGGALGHHFEDAGWTVSGTYRRGNASGLNFNHAGSVIRQCDLASSVSVDEACAYFYRQRPPWDMLILCPGTLEPVGRFSECDFDQWQESFTVNFTNQLRIVRRLLACRNREKSPLVLFFAGGGVNNATLNYSAYTASKITLIKMCELLDAEIADTRFSILGPGWVRTKIHAATLQAGVCKAGGNYHRTKEMLDRGEMTPMSDVIQCCEWLFSMPKEVISGRNFSLVYDDWRGENLPNKLVGDGDLFKLRRLEQ